MKTKTALEKAQSAIDRETIEDLQCTSLERPMTRNPFDLDIALLERRRWLAKLATQRGCSLDEAKRIEQEDQCYTRLWRTILAVFALGTAFILGGLS